MEGWKAQLGAAVPVPQACSEQEPWASFRENDFRETQHQTSRVTWNTWPLPTSGVQREAPPRTPAPNLVRRLTLSSFPPGTLSPWQDTSPLGLTLPIYKMG